MNSAAGMIISTGNERRSSMIVCLRLAEGCGGSAADAASSLENAQPGLVRLFHGLLAVHRAGYHLGYPAVQLVLEFRVLRELVGRRERAGRGQAELLGKPS